MTREQFISHVESTQTTFRRFLVALCCGDTALADDVAQESYIKAYLSCDSFSNLKKFNAWIFKIGYNTLLNHKRGEHPTAVYEEACGIAAQTGADSAFAYEELYEALDRISAKERMSLLLYYMQGYSIREIAEIQDVSQDAVRQYLSRGRVHLRRLLAAN